MKLFKTIELYKQSQKVKNLFFFFWLLFKYEKILKNLDKVKDCAFINGTDLRNHCFFSLLFCSIALLNRNHNQFASLRSK